jgi:lambda family phage minor tail protein L
MAVSAWTVSTAFAVGDIRRAATVQATGLWFRCTVAGTSGGSEPNWPTESGNTTEDNTVTWTAFPSVYEELSVFNPSAIIELFELRLDNNLHGSSDILRWHAGINEQVTGNIVWNGETYQRVPVKAEGFEYKNTGTLPRPTLTVDNTTSLVTALLLLVNATTVGNDLAGAEVRRIRTLKKFLDAANFSGGNSDADPYAAFPEERWFVDRKAVETRNIVSFELASKFDVAGQKLPKRQCVANICQWQYRQGECSYNGNNFFDVNDNPAASLEQDRCGKRLSSCKLRFGENAELPFGSFPSVGLVQ